MSSGYRNPRLTAGTQLSTARDSNGIEHLAAAVAATSALLGGGPRPSLTTYGEPAYPYVIPGDVAGSFIFRKIDADYRECGVPPDSQPIPPPGEPWELSATQRDMLAAWIAAGAPNN